MARQMSLARQIRVQKIQDKNRMVGETFNSTGITSQQIKTRESIYVEEWKQKTKEERNKMYLQFQAIEEMKHNENLHFSNSWEHNTFMRNFNYTP